MVDHKSKADFNAMSVAELKKYLQERGISASGYLKTSLVESPPQSKKWFCQWIQISKRRRPCFRGINNSWYSYTLKTVNSFNASPPFGLYDIFNYLTCSPELITGSTLRSKRALTAAYSSVDLPVWRSSVRRVFATDRSRQTFMHLSLSASRSQDAFRLRVATPRHGDIKEWQN